VVTPVIATSRIITIPIYWNGKFFCPVVDLLAIVDKIVIARANDTLVKFLWERKNVVDDLEMRFSD
jgi:hypothetical protein